MDPYRYRDKCLGGYTLGNTRGIPEEGAAGGIPEGGIAEGEIPTSRHPPGAFLMGGSAQDARGRRVMGE